MKPYNVIVNPAHRQSDLVRIVCAEHVPLDSRFA
jgi:hypothetical protein